MNRKIEEFLKAKKETEKKKRDEHLISLGLVDETKSTIHREYCEGNRPGSKYDEDKDRYYIEHVEAVPLEVTDEEYREILRYAPIEDGDRKNVTTPWANIIRRLSYVYLFCAVVINIIMSVAKYKQACGLYEDAGVTLAQDIVYSILVTLIYFVSIMGISKVVGAAEKYLQE